MRLRALVLVAVASVHSRDALAQSLPSARTAYRLTIAGGLASGETILSELSRVDVRGNVGAFVAVEAARRLAPGGPIPLYAGLFARVVSRREEVRIAEGPNTRPNVARGYVVGKLYESTIGARGELVFLGPLSVQGGLGATFARGPRDVKPLGGGSAHPSAELGLVLRAGARSRWSIDARAAAYRVGTSGAVDQAGAVRSFLFELRRDL